MNTPEPRVLHFSAFIAWVMVQDNKINLYLVGLGSSSCNTPCLETKQSTTSEQKLLMDNAVDKTSLLITLFIIDLLLSCSGASSEGISREVHIRNGR